MSSNQDRKREIHFSYIQGDMTKYLRITHAYRKKPPDKHIYMPTHTHMCSKKTVPEFPI